MINFLLENLLKITLTILIVCAIVYDVHNTSIKLEWVHVGLIAIAVLPWAHQFLESFSVSTTGIKADFKKLESKIEEKLEDIEVATSEDDDVTFEGEQRPAHLEPVTETEKRVLKAIVDSKYVRRSVTGISKEIPGLSKAKVQGALDDLERVGLVKSRLGKAGGIRWSVTTMGLNAAKDDTIRLSSD